MGTNRAAADEARQLVILATAVYCSQDEAGDLWYFEENAARTL